ncbi:MAG: DUF1684 domain-containing protein [Hymenobacter sp.]
MLAPANRRARYSEGVKARLLSIVLFAIGAASCGSSPSEEDYPAKIAAIRAAKDDAFKNAADSPVPADKKASLLPLAYFPIDEGYTAPATLEPSADRSRLEVPTSTGQIRALGRIGTLKFSLKGQPQRLTAFRDLESRDLNRLFVPFADLTSGTETYPAGRYMELDPTPTGIYVVDFNIAYHPYCYYSADATARFRRKKTGWRCRSAPASGCKRRTQAFLETPSRDRV